LLNIDNKISPLPIWCYISKPPVHLHNFNKLIRFWQNSASTMHRLLAIKVPNSSWIYQRKQ